MQPEDESDALEVFVPESSVEAAQDAIEALTEPDELIADRSGHSRTNSSRVEPSRPGLTSSNMHSEPPSASGGAGTLPARRCPARRGARQREPVRAQLDRRSLLAEQRQLEPSAAARRRR